MKFFIVALNYYKKATGGAEIQNYYIAQELIKRGHEVHYIYEANKIRELFLWKKDENINLHNIYIPFRRILNRLIRVKLLYQKILFKYFLIKIKPDICYFRSINTYLPSVLSIKTNSKFIYAISTRFQVEGKYWRNLYGKYFEKKMVLSLAKCDFIFFQTEEQKKLMLDNYGLSGFIIPNGHPSVNPRELDSKEIKSNTVLWVANLKPIKRPELFLRVVSHFREEKNIMFEMIGKGYNDKIEKEVLKMNKEFTSLIYHGFLSNKNTIKKISQSKLLINTSEKEGFPNTFIEAWKFGIPVISFVDPDNVIKNEKLGLSCKSLEEMIKAIELLFNNNQLYNKLSDNCINYFNNNLKIESVVNKIEKIIII